MIKKVNIVIVSLFLVIFLIGFRLSYKNSGKFRESIRIALIWATVTLSPLSVETKSSWFLDAKGFTPLAHERVISNQELDSLNDPNSRVILVKIGDGAPSVPISPGRGQPSQFPTPPSGGRPSRPVYVPKYRIAPKIVDPGLGADANPAGAGGGGENPEFDDNSPVPNKEQSQESKTFDYDYRSNDPKNKKKSKDQCELDENVKAEKIEIVYRIKENPALVREAERAGRDQDAQRSLNNLIEQLSLGNQNPGIGTENVFKDVFELRGKNRARVYYRKVDTKIEILAKSVKSNQQKVINILKKLYD
jgi:hypothetical protein